MKNLGAECIAKRDENGNLIPLGSIDSLPSVSMEKVGTDHWEKLWDKLYDWLNDTRLSVAPDETVKDDIERNERLAQADMLDEVMECMIDLESRREVGETDG